jgi:hypothetical protein
LCKKISSFFIRHEQDSPHIPLTANAGNASTFHTGKINKEREGERERGRDGDGERGRERERNVGSHYRFVSLTLIRMTKDEKGLAFFKGLLL